LNIYYGRLSPYHHKDSVEARQFAEIYIEAFGDADEVYGEENHTVESVLCEFWQHHMDYGRIFVAQEDRDGVIGIACVEYLDNASAEERGYLATIDRYLDEVYCVRRGDLPVWYFSELAVRSDYRNLPEHIGSRLIQVAMGDLRSRDQAGSFNQNSKIFVLTRTDAARSKSINAFGRVGFMFLPDIIQCANESAQVLKHGGRSVYKIWGYDVINPVSS
jgi:hypothetical protein